MSSAHDEMNQALFPFVVRLIAQRQIKLGGFADDALLMREGAETSFAMIAAHAAGADTTEGQVIGRQVNDGVVDTAAAKLETGHNLTGNDLVFRENVKGQWMWHVIELIDGITKIFIGEHWQNRAKDFFLHDCVTPFHIAQKGRLNLQSI